MDTNGWTLEYLWAVGNARAAGLPLPSPPPPPRPPPILHPPGPPALTSSRATSITTVQPSHMEVGGHNQSNVQPAQDHGTIARVCAQIQEVLDGTGLTVGQVLAYMFEQEVVQSETPSG